MFLMKMYADDLRGDGLILWSTTDRWPIHGRSMRTLVRHRSYLSDIHEQSHQHRRG